MRKNRQKWAKKPYQKISWIFLPEKISVKNNQFDRHKSGPYFIHLDCNQGSLGTENNKVQKNISVNLNSKMKTEVINV